MNKPLPKPLPFALAMFTACVGGALGRSYFMHEEVEWFFELASGVGIAFVTYTLVQWRQQKAESKSGSDSS